jgi:hypothetical protein
MRRANLGEGPEELIFGGLMFPFVCSTSLGLSVRLSQKLKDVTDDVWEIVVRFENRQDLREGWRKLNRAAARTISRALAAGSVPVLPFVTALNSSAVILPRFVTSNNPLFDRKSGRIDPAAVTTTPSRPKSSPVQSNTARRTENVSEDSTDGLVGMVLDDPFRGEIDAATSNFSIFTLRSAAEGDDDIVY